MLDRKEIDEDIDFLTGLVDSKPQLPLLQARQDEKYQLKRKDTFYQMNQKEERFELDSLKNVPVKANYGPQKLNKLQGMVNANTQKFLLELLRVKIQ